MAQSLKHLGPGNFVMVMGLAGLGLAWLGAAAFMGPVARAVGTALGGLAALVFLGLSVASGVRFLRYPLAWRDDLQHPVRHGFVAAIPVSVILLATLAFKLAGPQTWVMVLWALGCAAQLGVTVWVVLRWWRGPAGPARLTPVLIIPVVGNVLAPLAGVGLGWGAVAWVQFGLGLLLWPGVLLMLAQRWRRSGLWPERLLATSFIAVAPPAVVGLGALQFGTPLPLAWLAWALALGFVLLCLPLLSRLKHAGFALPWWSLSFPLAAFATLSQVLLPSPLAVLLLALASVVVFGLLLATVRSLRAGTLWVAEPVAVIVPA